MRTRLLAAPAALALVLVAAAPASAATVPDASAVVLVSGENEHLVDALAVAPLLGATDADLYLVPDTGLTAEITKRLRDADVDVYVIGGESAVSASVAKSADGLLAEAGSITRLGGADRYATSVAINAEVDKLLQVGVEIDVDADDLLN